MVAAFDRRQDRRREPGPLRPRRSSRRSTASHPGAAGRGLRRSGCCRSWSGAGCSARRSPTRSSSWSPRPPRWCRSGPRRWSRPRTCCGFLFVADDDFDDRPGRGGEAARRRPRRRCSTRPSPALEALRDWTRDGHRGRAAGRARRRARAQAADRVRAGAGRGRPGGRCRRRCSSRWSCSGRSGTLARLRARPCRSGRLLRAMGSDIVDPARRAGGRTDGVWGNWQPG